MRCLVCGQPTRLAVQSPTKDGLLANVRECSADPSHRFDTVEVPAAVVSKIGTAAVDKALEVAKRGILRRAQSARYREVVRNLMGHRPAPDIARFLGISSARVNQLINEIKQAEPDAACAPNPVGGYRPRIHRIMDDATAD